MYPTRTVVAVAAALVVGPITVATPATAVVGGTEVAASDYPWLAAIGTPVFFPRPSGQFCGGALIAADQLLTAAHCVDLAKAVPGALTVTFGRSDLRTDDGETVGVTEIRVHPDFHDTDFDGEDVHHDDLAVLTLDQQRPGPYAQLAIPDHDDAGYDRTAPGTVLGWGATAEDDDSNVLLHKTEVPLVSDDDCAAAYGESFDPSQMLCAGSPEADTGQFDSGGPLLVGDHLVGLTSWAKGTARPGFPGVYTRLSNVAF
ncbi:S1 family peptidase [Nocardia callitridis]|uniref:Serine protease n=1 Tax=Nocardia callitridis TaxID=648753 RepID=A0ABP9KAX7_9NOCA